MSTKIELHYSKTLNLELIEKGIKVWVIRLSVQVAFKINGGWTQPYEAIVDTGAPVSIIPPSIWQKCKKEILGDYSISGIVPTDKLFLPVKVSDITCLLLDAKQCTKPLKIKAYLSSDSRVPLVIGFDTVLSQAVLHSDAKNGKAYLII